MLWFEREGKHKYFEVAIVEISHFNNPCQDFVSAKPRMVN
jgi:hypothetical protein